MPPVQVRLAILHEVIRLDVVWPFGAETDAGPITSPDPAPLRLPGRDLQALLPPDPLHPLVVDHPARRAAQESCHLPVTQPAMLPDQSHKVVRQLFLVFPAPCMFP